MRCTVFAAVVVTLAAAPGVARAFTVQSFGPQSWGASDAALGFTKASVEDFEDVALVGGLGYDITNTDPLSNGPFGQLVGVFDPARDPYGKAFAVGAWDGPRVLISTADNQSHPYSDAKAWGRVVFTFQDGATRVGFSLADMEGGDALYVNGAPLGTIGVARGTTNIHLQSSVRNGYLVITAQAGERIKSVAIDNGQNGDGFAIDHLLVEDTAAPAVDGGVPADQPVATLFLTDDRANRLYRFAITPGAPPTLVATRDVPGANDVALRSTGELFVADFKQGSVNRFLLPFGPFVANGQLTDPALVSPEQVLFVGDELWVLGSDLGATRAAVPLVRFAFDAKGVAARAGVVAGGLIGANRGLAWSAATSDLYVSQCCATNQILHFHAQPDGTLLTMSPLTGQGVASPHGMVVTPARELLVANYEGSSVARFALDAEGQGAFVDVVTGDGLAGPVGLAVAPWGDVFVANQGSGALTRFRRGAQGALIASGTFPVAPPSATSRLGWLRIVESAVACAPPTSPVCLAQRQPLSDAGAAPDDATSEDASPDAVSDGPRDAAADAAKDAAPPASSSSGCGCTISKGPVPANLALVFLAVMRIARRRARR